MRAPVGSRVGAILEMTELKAEGRVSANYGFLKQLITLDDGRVVWGAQCWWPAEEHVRARIGDRGVVPAALDTCDAPDGSASA